jgi:hypothetical protein
MLPQNIKPYQQNTQNNQNNQNGQSGQNNQNGQNTQNNQNYQQTPDQSQQQYPLYGIPNTSMGYSSIGQGSYPNMPYMQMNQMLPLGALERERERKLYDSYEFAFILLKFGNIL